MNIEFIPLETCEQLLASAKKYPSAKECIKKAIFTAMIALYEAASKVLSFYGFFEAS